MIYRDIVKPVIDCVLSAIILMLVFPFLLMIAMWIKLDSAGPVIFRQQRVGLNGRIFQIIKFRTMVCEIMDGNNSALLTDKSKKITNAGKFIRKFHIDELLQLINVLQGHMSLVGPRPEVPRYVKDNNIWHDVLKHKPGITGLAAVKYSSKEYALLQNTLDSEATYINHILPHKLRYDLFYTKHISLGFDACILLWTIRNLYDR